MEWGSIADWVSGLGSIFASLVAIYLAGSERRAQRQRDRPEISVEVKKVDDDGWVVIDVTVVNSAEKKWELVQAEIIQPSNGLITTDLDACTTDSMGGYAFNKESRQASAAKTKSLGRIIETVGTRRAELYGGGFANKIYQRLHVFLGSAPARLNLRLSLASLEPTPDKFRQDVKRVVSK